MRYLKRWKVLLISTELLTTGYKDVEKNAESPDGKTLNFFMEKSRELGSSFVFSMATRREGKIYNTAYFICKNLVLSYDKTHLFKPLNEHRIFSYGDKLKVFTIKNGNSEFKFSLQICYDLRFPESFRKLAMAGVAVVFIPAQWPLSRIKVWKSMLVSRAAENGIFVAGSNRVGEENGIIFGGNSAIVSPEGEILVSLGAEEGIASVDINIGRIHRVRKFINVLEDIRNLEVSHA